MDEILEMNGVKMATAGQLTLAIKENGDRPVKLLVRRKGVDMTVDVTPRMNDFLYINGEPGADLKTLGDLIGKGNVHLDGKKMLNLEEFRKMVADNANREMTLDVEGNPLKGHYDIRSRGYMGMYPALSPMMEEVRFGPGEGFIRSWTDPYRFVVLNLKGMGLLFSGKMNVRENLSGPIRIAKIAGDVAYYKGLSAFIILMAKISIILMVMNFLPIPVVDGGHIMFFTIEAFRGRPLSEKTMERIQTVGVVFLIALGVFVIFNDIVSLPIIQKFIH